MFVPVSPCGIMRRGVKNSPNNEAIIGQLEQAVQKHMKYIRERNCSGLLFLLLLHDRDLPLLACLLRRTNLNRKELLRASSKSHFRILPP